MLHLTARGTDAVLACSALRERYRAALSSGVPGVQFVLLAADRSLLEQRLAGRRGHFAGTAILDRQLEDLEVPAGGLIVDAAMPVAAIVARICQSVGLPCGGPPGGDP
jgi:carbohydrate kinase (thermoresistant glucokinase family)